MAYFRGVVLAGASGAATFVAGIAAHLRWNQPSHEQLLLQASALAGSVVVSCVVGRARVRSVEQSTCEPCGEAGPRVSKAL